jgi:murein DD-endopeptidase MepM/ murein hydrolase activator NlpD
MPDSVAVSPEESYLSSRALIIPVKGVKPSQLQDSFKAARSGGRTHEAIDIMAKRGTPVLAADDGYVLRIASNRLGGKVVFLTDPDRTLVYYYAHLDRQQRGLRVGQRIRQGDQIGTVGHTGNAIPSAPHLHFQIMAMGANGRWWEGPSLNPYPALRRVAD